MLAMREHMRDEEMHRIFKCQSIWESVASIWFLFGSQVLKSPQRELLRFLSESRYFVGGLLFVWEFPWETYTYRQLTVVHFSWLYGEERASNVKLKQS